ncbi:MAG: DUF4055 domain-containing protein, partial [Limisphaerales bacterium]
MPVNSTHADFDASALEWSRARDVLSGEDAVRAAGEKYLARLDSQTEDEFAAYRKRASFFNATARTAEGYVGLIFRRPPFVKVPESDDGVGRALAGFVNDADMFGTTLAAYAKSVVLEVMGVGRAGSLVDWEADVEQRAYVSLYSAEQIINWQVGRVNGRNVPTLIVLREVLTDGHRKPGAGPGGDEFAPETVEQIRVLKLVAGDVRSDAGGKREFHCQVDIWQARGADGSHGTTSPTSRVEWQLVETRTPLRLGRPLPLLPFVFHGPRHARPDVDRLPLSDIITVNLDHFRLDADFKHGLHFTALPTAWVSGFDKTATLRIGSSTAWVSETPGATAGFLEFTGQGLTTFERAMDRDERLMAVLGSRLLEDQKKVGETAQAIELRQSGEQSVLSGVATSVSESLTQILRWVYWWNSTEEVPDAVTSGEVLMQLNTDFSTKGMDSKELQAVVAAWQSGAISRDTMFELFRKGEILPDGRTNQDEAALIQMQ